MLPTSGDTDKATASYDNGILEVATPKREEAKPRRIEVTMREMLLALVTRVALLMVAFLSGMAAAALRT